MYRCGKIPMFRRAVRMGYEWNWFRITASGDAEALNSATTVNKQVS
jgi:hypothetical protein